MTFSGTSSVLAEGRIGRQIAKNTSQVIFSTLAIQVTTFAVLATAGRVLPIESFAALSLMVATTMLSTVFFDLGLGLTATKHYGETGDEAYLRTAFAVWLLAVPLSAVLAACVWFLWGVSDLVFSIVLGCVLNLWNGVRTADQVRQDYKSFTEASLGFAAVRLLAGFAGLFVTHNALAISVCLFAVPTLVAPFSSSFKYAVSSFTGTRRPLAEVLGYTTHVHLTAVAFVAATYLPQYFVAGRLDAAATGSLGLIITFSAPIALVTNALRSVLLPKMLGPSSNLEKALWSPLGFFAICAAWGALMIGALLVGIALDRIYEARFPGISEPFFVFFAGYSSMSLVGLYSLSIHTRGTPHYGLIVNTLRLAILVPLLAAYGHSLMSIIVLTALTMVIAEALLAAYLFRTIHR